MSHNINKVGLMLLQDKIAMERRLQNHRWTDDQLALLDSDGLAVEAYMLSPLLQLEFGTLGCFIAYVGSLKRKK